MRATRRFQPARTLAAMTIVALVGAACGAPGGEEADEVDPEPIDEGEDEDAGDDTGDTGDDADADADEGDDDGDDGAAAGDGDAVRIGVLAPTTGNVAASGEDMLDGWNLFWDQQGGEADGTPVETIHEDTAGDPSTGLNKAEQLVGSDDVDMIVGPLLANVGLAVAEAMSREGVPNFHPIVSADDLTQRERLDGVLRIGGWTSSQTTHPLGEWAYEQGYERIVTMCTDYAFGHETCGGFANSFTDAGGEIVDQLWHPLGTQDFATYMSQIQAADADAAFVTTVGADSVRFVQAYDEFGLKDELPFIGNETTLDQSLLRNMGSEAEGLISVGHFAEGRDEPATQDFVDAYLEEYGHLPSYYAVGMYTAARWLHDAIVELDGDVSDSDALIEAVRGISYDDTPMGPMELDEYDNPIFNVYVREVQERDDGLLWNVPIETYEDVSQFWTYDPDEFMENPVYSRDYQGL